MPLPIGPNRYQLQRQRSGGLLAIDRSAPDCVYLLTPGAAPEGDLPLAVSGAVRVRNGRLIGLIAPARTHGYELDAMPDGVVRLRKPLAPQWSLAVTPWGLMPPNNFALLGLRDGSLLLLDREGVRAVSVMRSRAPQRLAQPVAPSDPDFDFTIDYQP